MAFHGSKHVSVFHPSEWDLVSVPVPVPVPAIRDWVMEGESDSKAGCHTSFFEKYQQSNIILAIKENYCFGSTILLMDDELLYDHNHIMSHACWLEECVLAYC